ncbi:hypothetical protein GGR34_001321 [Microvirga flocculans]|uniref:Uncharacterized protein n=1 Tax=Microvirga flocculans TaxID=217168 RepID=A0A7W6IDZ6_9HYPH|nr:hypothetical protein [Microvirga flocculans]
MAMLSGQVIVLPPLAFAASGPMRQYAPGEGDPQPLENLG